MNNTSNKTAPRFLGWRMVLLACLCVNVGIGFSFGAYGTFMPSMIAEFSASHSLASAGLSLMVAMMGACAPLASYAVRRWSIRTTVVAGFIFMAAGWALMSVAAGAWQFVLSFGICCGIAGACLVVVPPMTLINNWFIASRGRAVGITMVIILMMIVPALAAAGITSFGWRTTGLLIAASALVLAPLMLLIVDRPEAVGQRPLGAEALPSSHAEPGEVQHAREQGSLLRDPMFWLVVLCGGFYGGAGVAMGTHLVPFALGRGLDLPGAALLASMYGGATLIGGFLSGSIADRFGGARSFACLAFVQALAWSGLILSHGYRLLTLFVLVIGACANALLPVITVLLANVFGRERFARAVGLFSVSTTPFSMALPLIAGAFFDFSGTYDQIFLIIAALLGAVGVAICLIYAVEVRRQQVASAPAVASGS